MKTRKKSVMCDGMCTQWDGIYLTTYLRILARIILRVRMSLPGPMRIEDHFFAIKSVSSDDVAYTFMCWMLLPFISIRTVNTLNSLNIV